MFTKVDKQKLTWKDVVRDALSELGGHGHLSEINKLVKEHPKTKTNPTWQATIRRVVRQYKIFKPLGQGIYELSGEKPLKVNSQKFTEKPDINHGIAQGMLATLGKIYGYETYVPPHDQTIRNYQGKLLRDFISVTDCADVFRGPNLRKIIEIDTLWFDEDDYGLFPVYAFEIEETTRVKSGLDRLLKIPKRFPTQLFIIGPSEKEKDLYERYVNQTPFRDFKNKFLFRFYSELEKLYNTALTHHALKEGFSIKER
ncbi:MAG: hypothetical protein OEZ20_04905 [candidate division WOR-3 bacterium]|nr:hypothetical protein [candidate division WOR-3 bacterium]